MDRRRRGKTSSQLAHHKEREGNEFHTWADEDVAHHRRLQVFRYTFMGLITLYLPISQFSLEVGREHMLVGLARAVTIYSVNACENDVIRGNDLIRGTSGR